MRAALAPALLLAGCGTASGSDPGERLIVLQADRMEVVDGKGRYTGEIEGRQATIDYTVPLDRIDPARGHGSERIGATGDDVVVLIDRYATKVSGPDDRCATDGREAWVRVFALTSRKEIAAIPLESCRDRIAAKDVTWIEPNRFRIETGTPRVYAIAGESLTSS